MEGPSFTRRLDNIVEHPSFRATIFSTQSAGKEARKMEDSIAIKKL